MDNRNVFVAIALSMAVLLFWGAFFETPRQVKESQKLDNVQTNQNKVQSDLTPNINQEKIVKKISRKDALTEVDRVIIENENVKGSISLKGAIFDDLSFKNYKKDLKSEENVVLLNPKDIEDGYFIESGWASVGKEIEVPGKDSLWQVKGNRVLNQNNDQIKIIAECKKSSPSAGLIVDSYDPIAICRKYKTKGYKNLSILTEEKYFQGSNEDLSKVKRELNMPILQKDFIYDEWQIFESKSYGADCILLISEYLNFEQLQSLIKTAESLEIGVLVEFHRLEELEKIINLNIKNIGINNRNLISLETNVLHCLDVYEKNKDAVLEMLGRFSEDLLTYQKAIRNNDLKFLEDKFSKSKEIRKIIEQIGQAGSFDPTEKN